MVTTIQQTLTENNRYAPIIFNGDKYFPKRNHYIGYPYITGIPEISWKDQALSIRRNMITRKIQISAIQTPKECALRHLVNYPTRKWGSFQCSTLGTYGYGKSNFLNLLAAFLLARHHRILMFDDSQAEFRNLAGHGYYDKHNKFTPFIINVFVPKGYVFDVKAPNHNPLWMLRNNVNLIEFEDPKEIIDQLKPHKLAVVYTDAFDPASLLRLWISLMELLKRIVTINKSYIFMMHELADLFPEGAQKEIYNLIDIAKMMIRRFRKNRIGILTSFHETADVTYKISRKFGFVGQKRTVNKKNMTKLEEYSRGFNRSQIAISQGGYFREHTIGMFPELPDTYRIAPNFKPYYYDSEIGLLHLDDAEIEIKNNKQVTAPQVARIYQCWIDKLSVRVTCKETGSTYHKVKSMFLVWNEEND